LLAHRRPFQGGDRQALIEAIATGEPDPLSTLRPETPPELATVVERCLRKRPEDRYESAEGVHAALSALVPGWPDRGRRATPGAARAAAEASYRKGRHCLDSGDVASVRKGLEAFREALDLDPDFALAWCGLSDSYECLGYWAALPPEEAHPRARAAAERALGLEPELAAAHTSLATVLLDYYHDWDSARQHYELALRLDPAYAVGHQLHAELLRDQGRFDEALAEIDEAIRLDPLAPYFRLVRGVILHMARRHEEALAAFEALLQATPDYPAAHFYIGLTCASSGKLVRTLDALRIMDPSAASPDPIAIRGAALARAGRSAEAMEALRSLASVGADHHVFPFHEALIRLNLGEVESGITRLEEDVDRRTWYSRIMGVEPLLDPARGHPRFQALLERVGIRPAR
jgi:serine/threonine-protein kinase